MVDLTQFQAGINAALKKAPIACDDPRSAFLNLLSSEGFAPPQSLRIGKIDRIDGIDDRRGKKSGWYVYEEIEDNFNQGHIIGVASYGDWKLDLTRSWCSRSEQKMSAAELASYRAAREEMARQREEEERIRQEEAAKLSYDIWYNAQPANDDHPYLQAKGIKATTGLKLTDDNDLIIPAAVNNQIVTLQFIKDEGEYIVNGEPIGNKKFLSGGKFKGAWFVIDGEGDVIYIAEGYSTGRSIHEATGACVYICFNAGNIYEVSSYVKSKHLDKRIIIAGDDDKDNQVNTGRNKAEQAANGLGLECVFPEGFNDFNDMHFSMGINAVKTYLKPENFDSVKTKNSEKCEEIILRPDGFLGHVFDYYNATSGNHQPLFAIQCSLHICSTILGRKYKTNHDNWPNLYLVNVGKSATGKEHSKSLFERIMFESNMGHMVAGDGYTSAGAVFSTLLDKPSHGVIIDELGRYLEASRSGGAGNLHQREANTSIMEAISRSNSIMRPKNYSTMTVKKDAAKTLKDRYIHNPSISILGMTTPSTLFNSLDINAVKDGFINRFVICISDAQRQPRKKVESFGVPDIILSWIQDVSYRNPMDHLPTEKATPIVLQFTNQADLLQLEFEKECIERANKLEAVGMSELVLRSNEMAMKVALIHALSRDPQAKFIDEKDVKWAIWWVDKCQRQTTSKLKLSISFSDYEGQKKEILGALRDLGADGITKSAMNKTPPFSKYKAKDLTEIMEALKDAELAYDETFQTEGRGRPTVKWIALK